jgi:hypothetical protein
MLNGYPFLIDFFHIFACHFRQMSYEAAQFGRVKSVISQLLFSCMVAFFMQLLCQFLKTIISQTAFFVFCCKWSGGLAKFVVMIRNEGWRNKRANSSFYFRQFCKRSRYWPCSCDSIITIILCQTSLAVWSMSWWLRVFDFISDGRTWKNLLNCNKIHKLLLAESILL